MENSQKKGEHTRNSDKYNDFKMRKRNGNEARHVDSGLKSQKQIIKIKSICGKIRVFNVSLDIT